MSHILKVGGCKYYLKSQKKTENLFFFSKSFLMTKINNFIYIWFALSALYSNIMTVLYIIYKMLQNL